MAGYPDYDDITDYRARRRKQEMEAGRQLTLIDMASGLCERLSDEIDPKKKHHFRLHYKEDDFREWTVSVALNKGKENHVEKFIDFPSDELKAKLILLGA